MYLILHTTQGLDHFRRFPRDVPDADTLTPVAVIDTPHAHDTIALSHNDRLPWATKPGVAPLLSGYERSTRAGDVVLDLETNVAHVVRQSASNRHDYHLEIVDLHAALIETHALFRDGRETVGDFVDRVYAHTARLSDAAGGAQTLVRVGDIERGEADYATVVVLPVPERLAARGMLRAA